MVHGVRSVALLSTLALTLSACCPRPPANSLVAWLAFDGSALDSTSYCNDGVVSGAQLTPDRHGAVQNAYLFAGGIDKITIGNESNFEPSNFTIALWMRPDSIPASVPAPNQNCVSRSLIHKGEGTGTDFYGPFALSVDKCGGASYYAFVFTSTLAAGGNFDFAAWTAPPIAVGVWHHLAMSNDGVTMRLYVDGKPYDTFAYPGPGKSNDAPVVIGGPPAADATHQAFDGAINDVRYYNYALAAADIAALASR